MKPTTEPRAAAELRTQAEAALREKPTAAPEALASSYMVLNARRHRSGGDRGAGLTVPHSYQCSTPEGMQLACCPTLLACCQMRLVCCPMKLSWRPMRLVCRPMRGFGQEAAQEPPSLDENRAAAARQWAAVRPGDEHALTRPSGTLSRKAGEGS